MFLTIVFGFLAWIGCSFIGALMWLVLFSYALSGTRKK